MQKLSDTIIGDPKLPRNKQSLDAWKASFSRFAVKDGYWKLIRDEPMPQAQTAKWRELLLAFMYDNGAPANVIEQVGR